MKSWLVGAFVFTLAVSFTVARKPPPLPTETSVAGTWVAIGEYGAHFRLVLSADGNGSFGIGTRSGRVYLYGVDSLEIKKYRIRLRAVSERPEQEDIWVQGQARAPWLDLSFRLWGSRHTFRFYREDEQDEVAKRLRGAMNTGTEVLP